MDEVDRLNKRIAALETENRRLRSETQRLWSTRDRLWDLIEPTLGLGTWIWDVASRDIEWSRNLFRLLGYDPDVTPLNEAAEAFDQQIHPEDLEIYLAGQERALGGDCDEPVHFRFVRADGSGLLHVALFYNPVRDASGEIVAFSGAILDVTARNELETELVRAGRLEVIGRLAGGVAHDFNNLLTIILGSAEVILMDSPGNPDAEQIAAAVEVGASLTGQLLSFTRQASGTPVPLCVDDVVARTEPLIRRLLREDVEVEVDLESQGALVLCEPGQLQSAIVNLAVNARDAMPEGGRLVFHTRLGRLPSGEPALLLRVADTGVGMSEKTLERVFEPFFTTKHGVKGPQGTGLGLASVRSFARSAGGDVSAETELGAGSTFEMALPIADAPPQPEAARATASVGIRDVLVVEDSPGVRRVLGSMLQRAGLEPRVYASADEVLEGWPQAFDDIRVLITDVVMPGMSGHELAARLREDRPDLGVVFVTGYDPERTSLERSFCLRKPFTRDQLVGAIEAVLPVPSTSGD